MMNVRNFLVVAPGVALVSLVVMLVMGDGAGAQGFKPAAGVFVTNSSEQPVPVRDVQAITRTPFKASVSLAMGVGTISNSETIQIPAGKMFVAEFVSARGTVPQDQSIMHLSFIDSEGLSHYLPWSDQGLDSGFTPHRVFVAAQQLRIYATEPTLVVGVARNAGDGLAPSIIVTVNGYLVDCSPAVGCGS
jgi:hypothetical protein